MGLELVGPTRHRGLNRWIAPPGFSPINLSATGTLAQFGSRGVRVVASETGSIRDVSTFPTTLSGNVSVAIYDCGETTSTVRTKLWDSGSVAMSGFTANVWSIVGDPGAGTIPCYAGQQFDFFICADNATAQIGRIATQNAGANNLPAAFNPVPGAALPKLWFNPTAFASVTAWPASFTEAEMINTSAFVIPTVARVG